uniref:DUF7597 domain-containing protein n=1 Tax=Setaria viridis TaxID=4556 RepID=A0A4U6TQQ4_SETVI|nr:hypothetical protein SEVIR_7G059900v2 [Setaria viridis]
MVRQAAIELRASRTARRSFHGCSQGPCSQALEQNLTSHRKGFSLLVSFSKNRFRLTEESVNICLQYVLGGLAFKFWAEQLEDQIFKFRVLSRDVGFMISDLSSAECEYYKLAFFLYNDGGFHKALKFAKLDSGPSHPWVTPRPRKSRHSYAGIARAVRPPLSGANTIPLGKKIPGMPNQLISKSTRNDPGYLKSTASVFSRLVFPRKSVFEKLSPASNSPGLHIFKSSQWAALSAGPRGPAFSKPGIVAGSCFYCKRCLSPNHLATACVNRIKNLRSTVESSIGVVNPQQKAMAFLNVDLEPMMFPGFARVLVQGRPKYTRVVIPRAAPTNEDLVIVTITNPPHSEIPYTKVRDIILGLLEGHYELRVMDIQKSPFHRAQAFVRMNRVTDRDALVQHSPHQFQGFNIDMVQHNRGPNARRVQFNRECWLMLVEYPVDTRTMEEIKDTIRSFGRLIYWQMDSVLARVVVKARVTNLEDIPHYLVLSEGDDFEGVSITVQVEIMQQNLLGGQLLDEDIPPPGLEDNFIFLGIGLAQPQHQQQ